MMGALAWQATIIKMLIWCAGWEIAQGIVFHPWVLSPFVSLCPASCCWLLVLRNHHGVLQIEWSYSATHKMSGCSHISLQSACMIYCLVGQKPHEDLHEVLLLGRMKICICCRVMVFLYDVHEDQLQCLHGGDRVII